MTEFEIQALKLLTDISDRLHAIEKVAERFEDRFQGQDRTASNRDLPPGAS